MEDVLRRMTQIGVTKPSTAQFPAIINTDGEGTVKAGNGTGEIACKRRQGDVSGLRESLELGDIKELNHIPGPKNIADPLTKVMPLEQSPTMILLRKYLYSGDLPPIY